MTKPAALTVAPGLKLTDDVVTLAIAVLGNRNSGKTNTGVVIAEDLLALGHQVVIVDPLDVWWGLKSSADGRAAGYPVIVLGGQHGDVPLADTDGRVVADFIVESRHSVILSLRHISKAGQRRFVADLAEQVYRRKGEPGRNTPALCIIDEASSFVPQRVMGEEARMLGAIEDWVRRGRASGIGVVLIDQRAASVNKDVLTQIELLVAHRHTSPQDRKALQEWVKGHDTAGRESEFMETLASLRQGEAWFWSPGWLDIFKRVQVRARRTYDSSRTPERGQAVPAPKALAEVDLEALKGQLAKTIEQARDNDPRQLKAQIADLARQLKSAHVAAAKGLPAPAPKVERVVEYVEVPVFPNGQFERLLASVDRLADAAGQVVTLGKAFSDSAVELSNLVRAAQVAMQAAAAPRPAPPVATSRPRIAPSGPPGRTPPAPRPSPARENGAAPSLAARQLAILDALAWLESVDIRPANRTQLALLAGASPTSSGYANNLGALRTALLIDYPSAGMVGLTFGGRAQATAPERAPTTEDLQRTILGRLPGKQGAMLRALIDSYPEPLSHERLAEASGQSITSSGYANNRGALRSLGLIDYPTAGLAVALPALFLEG